jgi:hypothetical protein
LDERRAQTVLLVRAFEEADPDGIVLPAHVREAATRRAMVVTGVGEWEGDLRDAPNIRNGETVMRRARLLYTHLLQRVPVVRRARKVAALGAGTGPALVLVALGFGLLTNLLGPLREINLLSFPLLGILAWNVAVYVTMIAAWVARRPIGDFASRLPGLFMKGALWRRLHGWKIERSGGSEKTRINAKALIRFGAMWNRLAGPLLAARVHRMLHLGAMAMAVGAVGGMYVRGIAFEYRATWESTWLDAGQVQGLFDLILSPAAVVLGVTVPAVAPLQGPEGSGVAAPWIHLFAMTAILVVVVPRGLLALLEGWRARRTARSLPVDLDEIYYRRLFTAWRGARRTVEIVPYSFSPGLHETATLKTLLFDFFGARADIRMCDPLPYGEEIGDAPWASEDGLASGPEVCVVIVFNLAQSPEPEVHGTFLDQLKSRVEAAERRLLLLIDVSSYGRRVGVSERSEQRLRGWRRLVSDSGLELVPVDLDRPADDDILTAVRDSMWTGAEA